MGLSGKNEGFYYPGFDYLRIILATTVAMVHSGLTIWEPSANLAVQVFFALSGWLIGGILLKATPQDLPRFYFNRAARIWIPYFVAIALLVIASLLKEQVTPKWLEFVFYKITFVYNLFAPQQLALFKSEMPLDGTGHHFWSICAEEQFYLIAPFLLVVIPSRIGRSIWFWMLVALVANASSYWSYFGSISLGVLAAVVRQKAGDWHTSTVAKAALAASGTTIFAATYFGQFDYRVGAPLFAVCLVLLLAQPGKHSLFAAWVGGISYPMYLNHWIGVFIANAAFKPLGLKDSLLCRLSGVAIALVVAAILYALVDRTIRQNRDRYFVILRGKIAAALGFGLVAVGLVGGLLV